MIRLAPLDLAQYLSQTFRSSPARTHEPAASAPSDEDDLLWSGLS